MLKFAYFGISICLVVALSDGQEFSFTVGKDIAIATLPNQKVDVKLSCTGSNSDLSFYLKNMLSWSFIDADGLERPLTIGFYPSKSDFAMNLYDGPDARYKLDFRPAGTGYGFNIDISGVKFTDNGTYRCSSMDENNKLRDSKEIALTVVKPIKRVFLELRDMDNIVLKQSNEPISNNMMPLVVPPGEYMIQCDAYGSNPAPVMAVGYNSAWLNSTVETARVNGSYHGSVSILNQVLVPHPEVQHILCLASIPDYSTMKAGMTLKVVKSEPVITCNNLTTIVGNRDATLGCEITIEEFSKRSLSCSKVTWLLGHGNTFIENNQSWVDPNGKYGTLESSCEKRMDGLSVNLTINAVERVHFEEHFYVVYTSDDHIYRQVLWIINEGSDTSVNTATINIGSAFAVTTSLFVASVLSQHLCLLG